MTKDELCTSISDVISGYRDNEFGVYDKNHVERWINQFDETEQLLVLKETNRILKLNYITQKSLVTLFNDTISCKKIVGNDEKSFWENASLLNIQQDGQSQKEFNDVFCSMIQDKHGLTMNVNTFSNDYFYIDDFIFSGNRLFTDLKAFIEESKPNNCTIRIVTLGYYTSGQYETRKKLNALVKKLDLHIEFIFFRYDDNVLENRLYRKDYSDVFWPTKNVESDKDIKNYVLEEGFDAKYREPNGAKNNIFSRPRRDDYERIMLKYGLKILSFPKENSFVVKPLGYKTFKGFGFGSTVFSFRNCPNNNPLVFWWGDPKASSTHPFSKWYPLLQRKTY